MFGEFTKLSNFISFNLKVAACYICFSFIVKKRDKDRRERKDKELFRIKQKKKKKKKKKSKQHCKLQEFDILFVDISMTGCQCSPMKASYCALIFMLRLL